jgi:hypothetical protein
MHAKLLRLFSDPFAATVLIEARPGSVCSPARLFKAVYCCNLIRNGEFLERTNSTRGCNPGGSGRSVTWVSRGGQMRGEQRAGMGAGLWQGPGHASVWALRAVQAAGRRACPDLSG